MFERFTKDARAVVVQAQEEARLLRHEQVDSGHLLLAMLSVDGAASRALASRALDPDQTRAAVGSAIDGLDPDALAAIGIDLTAVRQATEAAFGEGALDRRGGGRRGHLRFTPEAKKALELSLRVAIKHGHRFISDGHLLLALLMLPKSAPVRALRLLQVDLDALGSAALRELTDKAA